MKTQPEARVCAICGKTGGTLAYTLLVRWLKDRNPSPIKFGGDYLHSKCAQAHK